MRAGTKHMKLSHFTKRVLAVVSSVGLALTLASCGPSNYVDFVYVTSNLENPGQIYVFLVDSESGALVQIRDSPYPSEGRNPVYDVASPDGKNLYVANHDDNTIVHFAIGRDAKLYPLQTVNTPGTEPVALAMNASGTDLFVLDYYAPAAPGQPTYTDLNPGPGAVAVFPVDSNGNLGTPLTTGTANYWPVQCFPTNLALTPNGSFVYVSNTNAVVVTTSPPVTGTVPILPATCPDSGTVSGFAVNGSTTNGSQSVTGLTQIAGSPFGTGAGSQPTGVVADPDNASLYVTDSSLNQLYTFSIQPSGALTLAGTAATGTMPMGATVVSSSKYSGKFLYVTNYTGGSISAYSLSSGLPSFVATTSAGTSGPLCLLAEPRLLRFLYATDYIGGAVGGSELDPSTGTLIQNEGSPYHTAGQPTCVAAVPHAGNPQSFASTAQ